MFLSPLCWPLTATLAEDQKTFVHGQPLWTWPDDCFHHWEMTCIPLFFNLVINSVDINLRFVLSHWGGSELVNLTVTLQSRRLAQILRIGKKRRAKNISFPLLVISYKNYLLRMKRQNLAIPGPAIDSLLGCVHRWRKCCHLAHSQHGLLISESWVQAPHWV